MQGYTAWEACLTNKAQTTEHMLLPHYPWKLKDKVRKQSILPIETNVLMLKAIVSHRDLKWKRRDK